MTYPVVTILLGAALALVAATMFGEVLAKRGFPLPAGDRRIGCVDGLRGYLALSVMIHHFVIWLQITRLGGTWSPPSIKLFNQLGTVGVGLFFMTTGLVFYPRILRGLRGSSWRAIYTTRVFRIVPLVLLSFIFVLAVVSCRTGCRPDGRLPVAAVKWLATWNEPALLCVSDAGRINAYVLWSLNYEWRFYLVILPLCAAAIDVIRGRLPSVVVPLILLVGAMILRAVDATGLPLYLPLFAMGMLALECTRNERIACALRGKTVSVVAAIGVCGAATAFSTPYTYGLPFFALFFTCVACGNDFWGVLRWRGALVLGEVSYSIYLLHAIVLSLVFTEGSVVVGAFSTTILPLLLPVVALVVVALSATTYRFVERPALQFGARLARHWSGGILRRDSLEAEVAP